MRLYLRRVRWFYTKGPGLRMVVLNHSMVIDSRMFSCTFVVDRTTETNCLKPMMQRYSSNHCSDKEHGYNEKRDPNRIADCSMGYA